MFNAQCPLFPHLQEADRYIQNAEEFHDIRNLDEEDLERVAHEVARDADDDTEATDAFSDADDNEGASAPGITRLAAALARHRGPMPPAPPLRGTLVPGRDGERLGGRPHRGTVLDPR